MKKLNKEYKKSIKNFIKWIKYRKSHDAFKQSEEDRMAAYLKFDKILEKRKSLAEEAAK